MSTASRPTTNLVVGRHSVTMQEATAFIKTYTTTPAGGRITKKQFYAWPYYDALETGSSTKRLNEGDLLAPVLLNVNPGIHGFASLRSVRQTLERALASIPSNVSLADASDHHIAAVASMFSVLDEKPLLGIQGTTLSKVLHRKRPHLIPLHDQHVRSAYVPFPVPRVKGRSWERYMVALMVAMKNDLEAQRAKWKRLTTVPRDTSTPLTELRALDIVAWSLGTRKKPAN